MPGIVLTLSEEPRDGLAELLAEALTELTCRVLGKARERTMVIIRHVPQAHWFIAGRSLANEGKNSFRLEVTITDETNTKAEKATYHREAFDLLSRHISNLHPHSNIHVIDCRASAYGYGGVTQEWHSHH